MQAHARPTDDSQGGATSLSMLAQLVGRNFAGSAPEGRNFAGGAPEGRNFAGGAPEGRNFAGSAPEGRNFAGGAPDGGSPKLPAPVAPTDPHLVGSREISGGGGGGGGGNTLDATTMLQLMNLLMQA